MDAELDRERAKGSVLLFGQYTGKRWREVPRDYLEFLAKSDGPLVSARAKSELAGRDRRREGAKKARGRKKRAN